MLSLGKVMIILSIKSTHGLKDSPVHYLHWLSYTETSGKPYLCFISTVLPLSITSWRDIDKKPVFPPSSLCIQYYLAPLTCKALYLVVCLESELATLPALVHHTTPRARNQDRAKGQCEIPNKPQTTSSKGTAIAAHTSLERGWLVILELWVVFLPLLLFRNEGLTPSWHRVGLFDVAFLWNFARMKEENHVEVGKPGQMLATPRSSCQCPASSLQSGAASLFSSLFQHVTQHMSGIKAVVYTCLRELLLIFILLFLSFIAYTTRLSR